jgi:hypothetical protein
LGIVRIILRFAGAAEVHEVEGREIRVGRAAASDLVVDHPSLAADHARLLVRRDRLILLDLNHPGKITRLGPKRLHGPLALPPGAAFHLGDVEIRAEWIADGAAWVGRTVGGALLEAELPSAHPGVRRFRIERGELALLDRCWPAAALEGWRAQLARSAGLRPPLRAVGQVKDRAFVAEDLAPGIRLSPILRAICRGLLLPAEARVAIAAQAAEALGRFHRGFGVHGWLEPEAVWVTGDGEVMLPRPPPAEVAGGVSPAIPAAPRSAYLAPERRRGGSASRPADLFALGRIAQALGRGAEHVWPPGARELLGRLAAAAPERRDRDPLEVAARLRASAVAEGLDPSTAHIARVVRVLQRPVRPIARVNRSGGTDDPSVGVGISAPAD